MSRTTTKILARKSKEQAHKEVEVTLDWSGVSRQDLEILARNALLYDLHCQFRISKDPIPETVFIAVREVVHHEPVMLTQYNPVPRETRKVKELLDLMSVLTEEERVALMGA